ncbi:MAG: hypothetical protein EU550_01350 [Promethearchaeota archaeon]|nr:MAG: hypothetical protein EU550_01350 [Candidatus Lokiarchaeota archaeon]
MTSKKLSSNEISKKLDLKIKEIKKDVLSGKIHLLNTELVPIFQELKNSLDQSNLSNHSKIYISACKLLNDKFEELRNLLSSLDNEEKFKQFLNSNPSDIEIYSLFENCWRHIFESDELSFNFLRESKDKLLGRNYDSIKIEHLETLKKKGNFILEAPPHRFTELMTEFYEKIHKLLPCSFDEVFYGLENQVEIYEKFIYILHLLQLGKIKYQKDTHTLYL